MRWARQVGPASVTLLPPGPGVYRFRDRAGRVLYVGRAVSLRRRVPSYWGDLGDRGHLAPMVARIATVEAVACDSAHEAAWLERNLLQRHRPPWNRSLGGQEARDAVSGLGRVLPLAHAADWQAGTERDLARVRGASPGDRAGLARAIAAVLSRDPAAVSALRADLAARRDAAAAALAFELAGKLQAELDALDWITGEQKVTMAQGDQADADVYGWADGVLVCFEIRGGRMSSWRQRPCGAAAARRHLAETPPGWADFARRNAELAARLRSPRAEWAARPGPSPPGTCAG